MAWKYLGILFIIALLVTSIGFRNYVWFLSIGYGLAIAACSLGITVLFHSAMDGVSRIQIGVLVFYGMRLAIFLIHRERSNATYRKTLEKASGRTILPKGVMITMWIMTAMLYTAQVSPILYRLYNHSEAVVLPVTGAAVSLLGAVIEAEADREKSAEKKLYPHAPAMHGLYKHVRCPNYFGEILVWFGVLLGGFATYTIPQFILALIAFLSIFYVMIDGAKRLDKRQMQNYGNNPEYRKYMDTTPIMIPFVPVSHLARKDKEIL